MSVTELIEKLQKIQEKLGGDIEVVGETCHSNSDGTYAFKESSDVRLGYLSNSDKLLIYVRS